MRSAVVDAAMSEVGRGSFPVRLGCGLVGQGSLHLEDVGCEQSFEGATGRQGEGLSGGRHGVGCCVEEGKYRVFTEQPWHNYQLSQVLYESLREAVRPDLWPLGPAKPMDFLP